MKLKNALEDVEIAFRQLEFAIKLLSFCELGHISPSDFDIDHHVMLKDESLNFPRGNFNDLDSIIRAASINVLQAFSASVLVLDQAFDAAGLKPDPEAAGNDDQLRVLVYMVRCAQAHGIAEPRWDVRGKYLRTLTVSIGGRTISLDLPKWHGKVFTVDQIGDYPNWYRIRDAACAKLSTFAHSSNVG